MDLEAMDSMSEELGATEREIVEHRGAVGIVPLGADGTVTLVPQFRKPVERMVVEIPAGTRDPGEDILVCLHRELREETGLAAGRVEKLAGYYSAIGFCTEYIEVYLATKLQAGAAGDGGNLLRAPRDRAPGGAVSRARPASRTAYGRTTARQHCHPRRR